MNSNGIKWGPFTLRIPFIHMKLLPKEFFQGLVISGATALAAFPVARALGLDENQAVAACFIISVLVSSGPIIFGVPFAAGWITPALPLVIGFFMSKDMYDGSYRVEAFYYMGAMAIEFSLLVLILGVTGIGKLIVEKVPNGLKSGIILGAAIAAFYQIFFSDFDRYIANTPISMISALILCTITTFSEPFKRLARKNKFLEIIGSLGLLPGFIVAAITGYISGEISWNIEWGLEVPGVVDVFNTTSPLAIGFPPLELYFEVFPLVLIGYLLLFGDFVTGAEVIKEGQSSRPDEAIDVDINTAHNSVGIRNLIGTMINPFFPTQGALWTGVHVVVVERWKQGKDAMGSLFDGIGSYYLMGIPFLFFVVPFIDMMEPLMIVALGVTLILTGLACAYIAMSLVTKNSEMAIALVTAVLIAFGGEYMWLGIVVGLILSYTLVDDDGINNG
jgi:hypothetical protein